MKLNTKAALVVTTLAASMLMSTSVFAAAIVTNGGFETPSIGSDAYYEIGAGANAVPSDFGWSVTQNNVDIVTYAGQYGGDAPSGGGGAQFLDLVGSGDTGAISQTLALTAGKTYKLSFDYANNDYSTSTASADVTVGSTDLGTVTHDSSNGRTLDWTHFSETFLATGNEDLTFTNTVGGGNGGVFLDNISVSAVPEPAAWALMLSGFFGLGAMVRASRRTPLSIAA